MLSGVFTAIVTPFGEDESVDYEVLGKLIDFNIENGINGIVPCGTTGESPTLTEEEHTKVVKFTVDHVNGRVPVIAGTGSNSTATAIVLTKEAERDGVTAALVVNPYYNKPTQEGLYRHFKAVADSVSIPIVVYNIKGRTGVNVETDTLMRLANDCENIVAVKEASGDMDQMKDVIAKRPEGFSVLSGDDGVALELIKNGGNGVISVASNVIPKEMSEMVSLALSGNMDEAEKKNAELAELFEKEFIETNPIPIKAMLAMKGMIKEVYRLPICEMGTKNRKIVEELVQKMNLI
ncbi:MAG: 4-hydroxy-tetrahydrodipicolinate synthase [Candidatus Diapherotrites archaeon]|nr:4-hydroxy-tetrahydrodipicolinate synthase [Candidatus Diapherotrites archaeon]